MADIPIDWAPDQAPPAPTTRRRGLAALMFLGLISFVFVGDHRSLEDQSRDKGEGPERVICPPAFDNYCNYLSKDEGPPPETIVYTNNPIEALSYKFKNFVTTITSKEPARYWPAPAPGYQPQDQTTAAPRHSEYVTVHALNLRTGPNHYFKASAQLPARTIIRLTGYVAGSWWQVDTAYFGRGWIDSTGVRALNPKAVKTPR